MAGKSKSTWYVSFKLGAEKRWHARATETFPNEREAKQFARAKLDETENVTAGTLNPHLPNRFDKPESPFKPGPAPQLQWLETKDLVVDMTYQREI